MTDDLDGELARRMDAIVERLVKAAPPLTAEQRARIADRLSPAALRIPWPRSGSAH